MRIIFFLLNLIAASNAFGAGVGLSAHTSIIPRMDGNIPGKEQKFYYTGGRAGLTVHTPVENAKSDMTFGIAAEGTYLINTLTEDENGEDATETVLLRMAGFSITSVPKHVKVLNLFLTVMGGNAYIKKTGSVEREQNYGLCLNGRAGLGLNRAMMLSETGSFFRFEFDYTSCMSGKDEVEGEQRKLTSFNLSGGNITFGYHLALY